MRDIYFLNSKALTQELMKNNISDYVALKHLIASTVIFGSIFEIPIDLSLEETSLLFDLIFFLLLACINIFGLVWIFQINQKNDDKDFFKRLVALSLPISLQIFIPVTIIFILIAFSGIEQLFYFSFFIELLASSIFYILIGQCLRVQVNIT